MTAVNEDAEYTNFSNVAVGTTGGGGGLKLAGVAMTATSAELNKNDDSLITLTTVDQTALWDVGYIHHAVDGKAYVYLQGVASCVTGSVVTYIVTTTGAATTALAITNAVGLVGEHEKQTTGEYLYTYKHPTLMVNPNMIRIYSRREGVTRGYGSSSFR